MLHEKSFLLTTFLFLFNLQEVTIFSEDEITIKNNIKSLVITLQTDLLQVTYEDVESTDLHVHTVYHPRYWTAWKEGHVAIGGLLGEIKQ